MNEILPYNPLAQISETFSWNTAVTPCWSAEERIALRDDPSLSITYSYALGSDTKLRDFYVFSEVNLGIPVRIPMWSSPHFHPESVLSAATSIALTGSLLHFYLTPGSEVILWKSATSYIPLVISTISSSSISFTTTLGSDFSAFYILPLLTGRFNKAVNFTKGSGSRKRASLVFEVLNFILPNPYDGYRVDKILQSSEFSTATTQDRDLVSSTLGIYENLQTSEIIKEVWKGGFNFASPADLVDFLILLKSLKGRAVSFTFPYGYLSPTGTATVVLSSDSVTLEHSFPRRVSVSVELEGTPISPPPVLSFSVSGSPFGSPGIEITYCLGNLFTDSNPLIVGNIVTKVLLPGRTASLTFYSGGLGNIVSDRTKFWLTNRTYSLNICNVSVDPVTQTIIDTAGYFGNFCFYGDYIYIPDSLYRIKKIDKLTGANISTFTGLASYWGSIKADSSGVYLLGDGLTGAPGSNTNLIVSSLSSVWVATITLPSIGSYLTLSPDYIWVTAKPDKLYRIAKSDYSITSFTVSGLITSDQAAYIEYLPDIPCLLLSQGSANTVSLINEVAGSEVDLITSTISVPGIPYQITGVSSTTAYVVTSAGISELLFSWS